MKFGKRLQSLSCHFTRSAYSAALLDYKALKKIIKQLGKTEINEKSQSQSQSQPPSDSHSPSPPPSAPLVKAEPVVAADYSRVAEEFSRLLWAEFNKINAFYVSEVADLQARLADIRVRFQSLTCSADSEAALMKDLDSLSDCVSQLRKFVVLNYLGAIKSVKKHDKNSKIQLADTLIPALYTQPFYNSHQVARLYTEIECLSRRGQPVRAEDYWCAICFDLLELPVVLSCGHRFCWPCLASASASQLSSACPTCRKPQLLDPSNYVVDELLQKFIQTHFPDRSGHAALVRDPPAHPARSPHPLHSIALSPLVPSSTPLGGHTNSPPSVGPFDEAKLSGPSEWENYYHHSHSDGRQFAQPKIEDIRRLNMRPWATSTSSTDKILLPWLPGDEASEGAGQQQQQAQSASWVDTTGPGSVAAPQGAPGTTSLAEQMAVYLDSQSQSMKTSESDFSSHPAFMNAESHADDSIIHAHESFFGIAPHDELAQRPHEQALAHNEQTRAFLGGSTDSPVAGLGFALSPLGRVYSDGSQTLAAHSDHKFGTRSLASLPPHSPNPHSVSASSLAAFFVPPGERRVSPLALHPHGLASAFRTPIDANSRHSSPSTGVLRTTPVPLPLSAYSSQFGAASSGALQPSTPLAWQAQTASGPGHTYWIPVHVNNPAAASSQAYMAGSTSAHSYSMAAADSSDIHAAAGLQLLAAQGLGPFTSNERTSGLEFTLPPLAANSSSSPSAAPQSSSSSSSSRPRRFICDFGSCGTAFNTRFSLKRHMKIHTNSKPFQCGQCEKSFAEKSTLLRHERVHTGERPYVCSSCSKAFSDRTNLLRHAKSHDKQSQEENSDE